MCVSYVFLFAVMVWWKFRQIIRYKTLRYFVSFVVIVTLFVHMCLLFSFMISEQNTSIYYKRNVRVDSRETTQATRDITWVPRTSSTLMTITAEKSGDIKRNSDNCNTWCIHDVSPPYKLSAVLLVRVYREDLAQLSSREMLQWLFYLRYAGFDHVFVYDAYVSKNESQYHVLLPLVQSGYVTYTDWSAHNPYTIKGTQISAYQHCIDNYGKNLTWHIAVDIDEYLFSPVDLEPNFMRRFVDNFSHANPRVSQITLQNYLFLGKPLDPQTHPFLIARLRRRTHKKANDLGKSLFQVAKISLAQVHHNSMRNGKTVDSDSKVIRLNHYWGARLQNWGEETPRIKKLTQPDYSIKPIVDRLNRCSGCFDGVNLYRKRWN